MASLFKNDININIGTTQQDVYTVPTNTTVTVIGLSLANTTLNTILVSVSLTNGSTAYLIKNAPIPTGASMVLFGGDQKLVMTSGNVLSIISNAAASVDAVISYLEIT